MMASDLRQRIRAVLLRQFPGLRRWTPGGRAFRLDAGRKPFEGLVHAPSSLHPLLSDPDLLVLARPRPECIELGPLDRLPSGELLEPVIETSQMRRNPASVCFVVPLLGDADQASLDRTLQSVLRQTDSSWELLFGCNPANADKVAHWLEIDWRVRRFESAGAPGREAEQLKSASLYATTVFVGLLRAGEIADDDLVMKLAAQSIEAPASELLHVDAGRSGGRFSAWRKHLLLDLDAAALEAHLQRRDSA